MVVPLGVPGGQMRGEHRAAELNRVAVMEHAIDMCRRETHIDLSASVVEIVVPAGFDHGHILRPSRSTSRP